jgi:hypothetical protein
MRAILTAALIAVGLGLTVQSDGQAAPAAGIGVQQALGAPWSEARYFRYRGRVCYRKCYREFVIGRYVCRTYC